METLINTVREILGTPDFYVRLGTSTNYSWDYGAMLEYSICGIILCVVIVSVFKFIRALMKQR